MLWNGKQDGHLECNVNRLNDHREILTQKYNVPVILNL